MSAAGERKGGRVGGPKLIALAGPFQSGKTTLLESMLARAGALARWRGRAMCAMAPAPAIPALRRAPMA